MRPEQQNLLQMAYQAYQQKRWPQARQVLLEFVGQFPHHAPAWLLLGNIALHNQQPQIARDYFERALSLDPDEKGLQLCLGQALYELQQFEEAAAAYQDYLAAYPQDSYAWYLLARTYRQGHWAWHEAQCLERILDLQPQDLRARSRLQSQLFQLGRWDALQTQLDQLMAQLEGLSWQQRYAFEIEYLRYLYTQPSCSDTQLFGWLERCQRSYRQAFAVSPPQARGSFDSGSPLRVAYLSHEFGPFASMQLLRPLLEHHGPQLELYAYDDTPDGPQDTALQSFFKKWRCTSRLSDLQLARLIEADQIQILVDLAGISHLARHGLYALHPAPVQVSGLGFVFSSGLPEMDYCFSDPQLCPPEIEALYPERVLQLPLAFHWQPVQDWPLGLPPVLQNGFVTLGSASTLNKLNPQVLELWVSILKALPAARLFLKTPVFNDPLTREHWSTLFCSLGIAPQRLRLEGAGSEEHIPYFYQQIDIALDPFPYQGGVTTCEALWMGVPVVVMEQPQWRARGLGVDILKQLGLSDWLAQDPAAYLQRVVDWAQSVESLVHWRHSLRERLRQSAICDGASFASQVEAAYFRLVGGRMGN